MWHWIKNFIGDFDVPGAAVGYILGLLLPPRRREQLSAVAFCAASFANYGPDVVWDDLQKIGKVAPPTSLLERKFLEAELASEYWVAKAPAANTATRVFDAHWLMDWDNATL